MKDMKILNRFENSLVHVGESRRNDLLSRLRQFSRTLGKPLDKATHEDIVKALSIDKKGFGSCSFHQRAVAVKQFYKTIGKKKLVKDIKTPPQEKA